MSFNPTPPFLKVRSVWMLVAALAIICPLLIMRLFLINLGWWYAVVAVAGLVALWQLGRPFAHTSARIKRGELLCWECGYTLPSDQASVKCPECGQDYSAEGLRKHWAEAAQKGSESPRSLAAVERRMNERRNS